MNPSSSSADAFPQPLWYQPPQEYRVTLVTNPHAVTRLRRIVRHYVQQWGMARIAEVVELAVSELASNVIRHVPDSYYTVRVLRRGPGVRVEVVDDSPVLPSSREAEELDESGRGLALLASIADAWGAEPHRFGLGKTVWCEFAAGVDR